MKPPLLFFAAGIFLLPATLLSGCAGMADASNRMAGIGVIKAEKSTFDGATVVTLSPGFLYNKEKNSIMANSVKLGARWSDKHPDFVTLVLRHDGGYSAKKYTNIRALEVNIDGEMLRYEATGLTHHSNSGYNSAAGTVFTNSENTVVVPLTVAQRMTTANDCRLRVHTTDGYEDATFSVDRVAGGGTARFYLKQFLAQLTSPTTAGQ